MSSDLPADQTFDRASIYLSQMDSDAERQALLACSAGITLDDDTAAKAVARVAGSNGNTARLVKRVKDLFCTRRSWDGTWRIAPDVRRLLEDHLVASVDTDTLLQLRVILADSADAVAQAAPMGGQLSVYRRRRAMVEASLQRLAVPERAAAAGEKLLDVWDEAEGDAKAAVRFVVDVLGSRMAGRAPGGDSFHTQLCFDRGLRARERGDRQAQERWFGLVWAEGKSLEEESPGSASEMHATAAHFHGIAVRDPATAEEAFADSFSWNSTATHRSQVLHSWGDLLSRQSESRWAEAEEKYQESYDANPTKEHRAQVLRSWDDLLSKQGEGRRRKRAETWRTVADLSSAVLTGVSTQEAKAEIRSTVADLNYVVLTGVSTKEATLRPKTSGQVKAEFSLQVDRPFVRPDGVAVSDLFLVDSWGDLARWAYDNVHLGTRLLVIGTLNKESYITRGGGKEFLPVIKAKILDLIGDRELTEGLDIDEIRRDDWDPAILDQHLRLVFGSGAAAEAWSGRRRVP